MEGKLTLRFLRLRGRRSSGGGNLERKLLAVTGHLDLISGLE